MDNLHSTVDLCQITIGNHLWRLVADTDLESGWAPVNELDSALGLQSSNSNVDILWNDIAPVQKTSCHVLPVARITLDHLIVRLEARHCDLLDGVGLVGGFRSRHHRSIGDQREVNARIGDKVGLKLVEVDV